MTNAILILKQSLAIGAAGFFGALSRVLVGTIVGRFVDTTFPLGTLIVNVSGCFILGAFYAFAAGGGDRAALSETTRLAIGVGFVGAYTTFSTLMYDSNALWTRGETVKAAANVVLSLILGIVAVRFGIAVGRRP
jgi:fluoride exporter